MELLIESQESGKNHELFLSQLPQKLLPGIWLGNVPALFVRSPWTSVKHLAQSFIIAVIFGDEFKQILSAIVNRKPDRKRKAHTCLGTDPLPPQAVWYWKWPRQRNMLHRASVTGRGSRSPAHPYKITTALTAPCGFGNQPKGERNPGTFRIPKVQKSGPTCNNSRYCHTCFRAGPKSGLFFKNETFCLPQIVAWQQPIQMGNII